MAQAAVHSEALALRHKQVSGKGLWHLCFEASPSIAQAFCTAGQFLSLECHGESSFFAMANPPPMSGEKLETVEFLIKQEGRPAAEICALKEQESLQATLPLGSGFPVSTIEGSLRKGAIDSLYLFSMGSALGAIRSLLLALLTGQAYSQNKERAPSLRLWQASLSRAHLPFTQEYAEWQRQGVAMEFFLDHEELAAKESLDSVQFRRGQVHSCNIIEALGSKNLDMSNALAVWAGSPAFGEELAKALTFLGLAPLSLLDNLAF